MKHAASKPFQIAFIVGGLLFSVLFLTLTVDLNWNGLIPDGARLDELRREEKKQNAELQKMLIRDAAFRETETAYKQLRSGAWRESLHGSPDVEIPKLISAAARKAGLELSGTGAVKRNRLNGELFFLEVDVNAVSQLALLVAFWEGLRSTEVPSGWKRIELRPEMFQNSDRIVFNGTLRFLGCEETAETTEAGS